MCSLPFGQRAHTRERALRALSRLVLARKGPEGAFTRSQRVWPKGPHTQELVCKGAQRAPLHTRYASSPKGCLRSSRYKPKGLVTLASCKGPKGSFARLVEFAQSPKGSVLTVNPDKSIWLNRVSSPKGCLRSRAL